MEANSALAVISSIATAIKETKSILDKIPITLLPSNKGKLEQAQDSLSRIDEKVKLELPRLANLIRVYSQTLSKVRVAKATSDKVYEITGTTDLTSAIPTFISFTETEFSGISYSIEELPQLDVSERGALDEKLRNIDRHIQSLKNLGLKGISQNEIHSFRENFSRISTDYSDMERILAKFLNKILDGFDLSKK